MTMSHINIDTLLGTMVVVVMAALVVAFVESQLLPLAMVLVLQDILRCHLQGHRIAIPWTRLDSGVWPLEESGRRTSEGERTNDGHGLNTERTLIIRTASYRARGSLK